MLKRSIVKKRLQISRSTVLLPDFSMRQVYTSLSHTVLRLDCICYALILVPFLYLPPLGSSDSMTTDFQVLIYCNLDLQVLPDSVYAFITALF